MDSNLRVGTSKELLDSLFQPNGTVDVIIRKVNPTSTKITYQGQNYTINKENVVCKETVLDDGKIWYSYSPLSYKENNAIVNAVHEYRQQLIKPCDKFRNLKKGDKFDLVDIERITVMGIKEPRYEKLTASKYKDVSTGKTHAIESVNDKVFAVQRSQIKGMER